MVNVDVMLLSRTWKNILIPSAIATKLNFGIKLINIQMII